MDRHLRWFFLRAGSLRLARDLVVAASCLLLRGAAFLDLHPVPWRRYR